MTETTFHLEEALHVALGDGAFDFPSGNVTTSDPAELKALTVAAASVPIVRNEDGEVVSGAAELIGAEEVPEPAPPDLSAGKDGVDRTAGPPDNQPWSDTTTTTTPEA